MPMEYCRLFPKTKFLNMFKKKNSLIVSISKTGLSACFEKGNIILSLPFPAGLLSDMEVTDQKKLTKMVEDFVQGNNLPKSEVILIIDSDICFEKTIPEVAEEQILSQVQDFLDKVPLRNPSYKLFNFKNEYHVVVINRRLYESLRLAFLDLGFEVNVVVPETALVGLGIATQLDVQSCRLLSKHEDYLRNNSFISTNLVLDNSDVSVVNKNPKTAIAGSLLAIFMSLGLGAFLIWKYDQSRKLAIERARINLERLTTQNKIDTKLAETIVEDIPASYSAQLDLKIIIYNASRIPGKAANIRTELELLGFAKPSVGDAPLTSNTIVVFSKAISPEHKELIIKSVENMHTKPVTTENDQTEYDAIVTLGKLPIDN